jgi:hypothetical protein
MGGLLGGEPDNSAAIAAQQRAEQARADAERRAEQTRQRSDEAARLAESRKQSMEQANVDRKKQVAASGRDSTVLTDDASKSLLGS